MMSSIPDGSLDEYRGADAFLGFLSPNLRIHEKKKPIDTHTFLPHLTTLALAPRTCRGPHNAKPSRVPRSTSTLTPSHPHTLTPSHPHTVVPTQRGDLICVLLNLGREPPLRGLLRGADRRSRQAVLRWRHLQNGTVAERHRRQSACPIRQLTDIAGIHARICGCLTAIAMFESNDARLATFSPKARHGTGTAEQRCSAHRDRNRKLLRDLAVGHLLLGQQISVVRVRWGWWRDVLTFGDVHRLIDRLHLHAKRIGRRATHAYILPAVTSKRAQRGHGYRCFRNEDLCCDPDACRRDHERDVGLLHVEHRRQFGRVGVGVKVVHRSCNRDAERDDPRALGRGAWRERRRLGGRRCGRRRRRRWGCGRRRRRRGRRAWRRRQRWRCAAGYIDSKRGTGIGADVDDPIASPEAHRRFPRVGVAVGRGSGRL
eukprot:scaffold91673_cov51-Phaeocystis_antarctica.AAC.2